MDSGLVDPLTDPRRLVAMTAVHNFRDLGGYPARDGMLTRWRTLFRADGLHRLEGDDLEVVRTLGLRTVIDLRSQGELDLRGTFPHHEIDVTFAHLPVIDTTWQAEEHVSKSDHDFLVWAYRDMLDIGAERFARAIDQLAAPGALPAVFHCAAGKDRTGVLAALILGALGVPRSVVLADYALTAEGIERMRAWALQESPELADRMVETPSAFMAALPEAMGEVLDGITAEHGSVEQYVLHIGAAPASLEALAEHLLVAP